MNETEQREIVQEIKERRCKDWLALDQWGPVCHGCGAEEFRIDGYCSIECRDFHSDDDIPILVAHIAALERQLARERSLNDHPF